MERRSGRKRTDKTGTHPESTNGSGEEERRARKRACAAAVGWQTVSGGLKEEKVQRLQQCVNADKQRVTDDGWTDGGVGLGSGPDGENRQGQVGSGVEMGGSKNARRRERTRSG